MRVGRKTRHYYENFGRFVYQVKQAYAPPELADAGPPLPLYGAGGRLCRLNLRTGLHLDHAHKELHEKLRWPDDPHDAERWRESWSSAFTLRHREVIATSQAMAVALADLARRIRRKPSGIFPRRRGRIPRPSPPGRDRPWEHPYIGRGNPRGTPGVPRVSAP